MRKKTSLLLLIGMLPWIVSGTAGAAPFAYITNRDNVSVIDTATNTVIGTILTGGQTIGVAANPAGTRVYVVGHNNVYVIDTTTHTLVGAPIPVGNLPFGVAINPAGTRLYVTNQGSNDVYVIDTATNEVMGTPIPVGVSPHGIAVNPTGTRVYVANYFSYDVSIIDAATNTVVGTPVYIGHNVTGIAVNPTGTQVYVTSSRGIYVIETGNHSVISSPSEPGGTDGVAVNPEGTHLYAASYYNNDSSYVSVTDTVTNTVVGTPILVGKGPMGVAINPAGSRVYVANYGSNNVTVIDTATNTVMGDPIPVGSAPWAFGQFIWSPVNPGQGTIGTEIDIRGSGFGAKRGKVLIGNAPPKIQGWTDSLIRCQITRVPSPGTYDVTIQPQARGSSPILVEGGFTVGAPQIQSLGPGSGSVGDKITINGFLFGTKKGKVTLGGKNCKVLSWTMDPATGQSEIQFVVPKGLDSGDRELKVTNRVGAGTADFTVE